MTEKRFTQKDEDDWEILDRNKHFAYAHSGYQAKKIIQELNELVETNRELYKENKRLKDKYNEQSVEYEEQIERLLNFKDKVFELFNREIEHNTDAILQATNEDVGYATIGFHTKMLKRYQKELRE